MNRDDHGKTMEDVRETLSQIRKYEELQRSEDEMRRELVRHGNSGPFRRMPAQRIEPRPPKLSRYSPHQGAKELARAARRAQAAS